MEVALQLRTARTGAERLQRYSAPYSGSPQYRNAPPTDPPPTLPDGRKAPVLRGFPRPGPRDTLAETARLGPMMAHRLCVALSFFYIGLWRAAPLRAAQAASTPGDSAAVTGQVIASETRAPIGGATVQVMGTRLTTSTAGNRRRTSRATRHRTTSRASRSTAAARRFRANSAARPPGAA